MSSEFISDVPKDFGVGRRHSPRFVGILRKPCSVNQVRWWLKRHSLKEYGERMWRGRAAAWSRTPRSFSSITVSVYGGLRFRIRCVWICGFYVLR